MTKLSELMTTREVADAFEFKTKHRYIITLIRKGQLKAIWLKGRYLITPQAVEDYRRLRISKLNQRIKRTKERKERDARREARRRRREL